jgi:hypothetical protein
MKICGENPNAQYNTPFAKACEDLAQENDNEEVGAKSIEVNEYDGKEKTLTRRKQFHVDLEGCERSCTHR